MGGSWGGEALRVSGGRDGTAQLLGGVTPRSHTPRYVKVYNPPVSGKKALMRKLK
jgi:hypothetical protein